MAEKEIKCSSRKVSIDLIKVIAIFFVILYHGRGLDINIIKNGDLSTYLHYFSRPMLSTCVPIFFFVNGYLLLPKKMDIKMHTIKTIRFTALTVLWGMAALLILMPIRNEYLSVGEFVDALMSWKSPWINYLWYMGALVVIYILFPLIKSTYDANKKALLWFLIIAVIMTFGNKAFCMMVTVLHPSRHMDKYNLFNIFNPLRGIHGYTIVYFILGGFASYYEKQIESFFKKNRLIINITSVLAIIISSVCLGAYGVLVTLKTGEVYDTVWNGYDTIFTLISVISIYLLCKNYKSNSRVVTLISKNTLTIYLVHDFFIEYFLPIFRKTVYADFIIVNIAFAILVGVVSLGIGLVLKKIPGIRKLLI